MAAPIGHGLVGMAIARRMGVRSPLGLASAFFAANLPDADIPIGWAIGRDLHRGPTHTANFALTAGALAGAAGALSAGSIEGERDLIADALLGAAVVGSHIALDRLPYFPAIKRGPKFLDLSLINWVIDSLTWGAIAYLLWPKGETASPPGEPIGP